MLLEIRTSPFFFVIIKGFTSLMVAFNYVVVRFVVRFVVTLLLCAVDESAKAVPPIVTKDTNIAVDAIKCFFIAIPIPPFS